MGFGVELRVGVASVAFYWLAVCGLVLGGFLGTSAWCGLVDYSVSSLLVRYGGFWVVLVVLVVICLGDWLLDFLF